MFSNVHSERLEKHFLKEIETMQSPYNKAELYLEIATHYVYKPGEEKNDLDKALRYATNALRISSSHKYQNLKDKANILTADIFLERKEVSSTKKLILQCSDAAKVDIMLSMSRHYIAQKWGNNWADSSIHYANQARMISEERNFLQKQIESLNVIGDACVAAYYWTDAEDAFLKSIKLSSRQSKDNPIFAKSIADAQAKLSKLQTQRSELARKDRDLLITKQNNELLKKDALIQQNSLQRANLIRNITYIILVFLLVIMVLLFTQYRNKKRTNNIIQKKNKALQQLVQEKEWLLREIHHRVKNNLQTIVSLLESQSRYLNNDALVAIRDGQNRVYAMSLIHQKLYLNENLASSNMASYIPELISYLKDSYDITHQIRFNLQIPPIELDVTQAIPIGLIINEAVTNSIKYAFPKKGNHEITLCIEQDQSKAVQVMIQDNGIGLSPDFDGRDKTGLGLKLIKGLTEDINGKFEIHSSNGTKISIRFMANEILQTQTPMDIEAKRV